MGNYEPEWGKDESTSMGQIRNTNISTPGHMVQNSDNWPGLQTGALLQEGPSHDTGSGGRGLRPQTMGGANENASSSTDPQGPQKLEERHTEILQALLAMAHEFMEDQSTTIAGKGAHYVGRYIQQLDHIRGLFINSREGLDFRQMQLAQVQHSRPKDATDILALNLSTTMINPRHQCFANAVLRCWARLPVYAPLATAACWNKTQAAMEAILTAAEEVDVASIPELELFWRWYPLDRQADVADFTHCRMESGRISMAFSRLVAKLH